MPHPSRFMHQRQMWDDLVPEELKDELASASLVLSFFSSRDLGEAYLQESMQSGVALKEMAQTMRDVFPDAMRGYAGVLTDPADRGSVVSSLALDQLAELERGGALAGGMHVKASAARIALEGGVPRVHVVSGTEPEALLGELYTTQGTGTLLTVEPEVVPA